MKNDMKLIMESWRSSILILENDPYDVDTSQIRMQDFVAANANVSKLTPKIRGIVVKALSKYEDFKKNKIFGKFTSFMSKATVSIIIGFLTAAALTQAGIVSPDQAAGTAGIVGTLSAVIPQGIISGLLSQIVGEVEAQMDDKFVEIFTKMQKRGSTPGTPLGLVVDLADDTEKLIKGGDPDNNRTPLYLNFIRDLFSEWNTAVDKYNEEVGDAAIDTTNKSMKDYGIDMSAQNYAID